MFQNELKPKAGSVKKKMRVGRGIGSKGRSCGRGDKGQNARKSGGVRVTFEGGQTPLIKRLPKLKGFNNSRYRTEYQVINVCDLNAFDGKDVNIEILFNSNLITDLKSPCKVLGNGDLNAKIKLSVHKASKSAKDKIEKAGGTLELI